MHWPATTPCSPHDQTHPGAGLIAWLRSTPVSPYRTWISIGLAFSVLGDILLAIPADLFVFGLAAFLCAHLAYLRGYCGITLRPALPALIFSAITGIALLGVLASHSLGPLLIPVALYALAISAMLWRALACGEWQHWVPACSCSPTA